MTEEQLIGPVGELPPGKVVGVGRFAVGNVNGQPFAVGRKCRHLFADLGGRLVCPWHQSAYDVTTGRMVRGPQGVFAKIPGLDWGYCMLTRVLPLRRGEVIERDNNYYVR
jgi:nitrite reductase/ring-hydroxylating ferredoxin subunit